MFIAHRYEEAIAADAAKACLDRAGFSPPRAKEPLEIEGKSIADLSIAELNAFIQEGRESIAREAMAIDVTPAMIEPPATAD
jgi:hypothetical protein